ncbi:MAG: helix-turn-helix transcriptional regulator [Oscillospiraceae bacterium]|nr:helix-turn-helix transcriptional regulator [Oscillospiraceae bacterium]
MYEETIRQRIVELRLKKNVSQREMSLSLGQNDSYINRIENGLALPSMQVFLYICEYFDITPKEFFDNETADPVQIREIIGNMKKLNEQTLNALGTLTKELADKR